MRILVAIILGFAIGVGLGIAAAIAREWREDERLPNDDEPYLSDELGW